MLIEQTVDKLHQMRLFGMANSLKDRMGKKEHTQLSVTDFIGFIVDDEWNYRENNRLKSRLGNAKFRDKSACVEDWDHHQPRGLKKTLFLEFVQNKWLEKSENLIVTGPCGSGKSYFAQALGQNACRRGFSVLYIWLPKFGRLTNKARADGTLGNLIKKIERTKLVILDDWGMVPLPEQDRHCLLEIVEDRYGLGSTIITSQLETPDWHPYLGSGNLADGVCDRVIHNAHRIKLNSEDSLRKIKNGLTQKDEKEK
ncbi:MAG: ATP-binding protein [Deltaproteobacteria bacterium]|nr:ATP-binding protein [Deltaproteobacteria bacterium]